MFSEWYLDDYTERNVSSPEVSEFKYNELEIKDTLQSLNLPYDSIYDKLFLKKQINEGLQNEEITETEKITRQKILNYIVYWNINWEKTEENIDNIRERYQDILRLTFVYFDISNRKVDNEKIVSILSESNRVENRVLEITNNLGLDESQKDHLNRYLQNWLENLWSLSSREEIIKLLEWDNDEIISWIKLLEVINCIGWNDNRINFNNFNIELSGDWFECLKFFDENAENKVEFKNFIEDENLDKQALYAIKNTLEDKILENLSTNDKIDSQDFINKIWKDNKITQLALNYVDFSVRTGLYKGPFIDYYIRWDRAWAINSLKYDVAHILYRNGFDAKLSDAQKKYIDNQIIDDREKAIEASVKRVLEKNSRVPDLHRWNRPKQMDNDNEIHKSFNNCRWSDIASSLGIWESLLNHYSTEVREDNINENRVFARARMKFFKDYYFLLRDKVLKSPYEIQNGLYKETEWFTKFESDWKIINKIKEWCREWEFEQIINSLKSFNGSYLKTAREELVNQRGKIEKHKDIKKNNAAIGLVIEGIQNVFKDKNNPDDKTLSLELNENIPVELNEWGNSLSINWTYKWEIVKIEYDLITWCIYMNTSIWKSWENIVFWENEPILLVWQIKDFNQLLDNYDEWEIPENNTHNNSLWKNWWSVNNPRDIIEQKKKNFHDSLDKEFDTIGESVRSKIEINKEKNSVTSNLLKTLWLNNAFWTMVFEKWSDAYKVLEIINNTDDLLTLESFSDCMKIIVSYAWKKWGSIESDIDNENYRNAKELSETLNNGTVNSDLGNYEIFKSFRKKVENIHINEVNNWSILQIPSTYQNGLASLIYEYFTNKAWEPMRRLDREAIKSFTENLTLQASNDSILDAQRPRSN